MHGQGGNQIICTLYQYSGTCFTLLLVNDASYPMYMLYRTIMRSVTMYGIGAAYRTCQAPCLASPADWPVWPGCRLHTRLWRCCLVCQVWLSVYMGVSSSLWANMSQVKIQWRNCLNRGFSCNILVRKAAGELSCWQCANFVQHWWKFHRWWLSGTSSESIPHSLSPVKQPPVSPVDLVLGSNVSTTSCTGSLICRLSAVTGSPGYTRLCWAMPARWWRRFWSVTQCCLTMGMFSMWWITRRRWRPCSCRISRSQQWRTCSQFFIQVNRLIRNNVGTSYLLQGM